MTAEAGQSEPVPSHDPAMRGFPPVLGLVLVALLIAHVARITAPMEVQLWAVDTFAVHPLRFAPGSGEGFSTLWGALAQLSGSAFLHFNWVHLGLNSAALLQAGVPVARAMGEGRSGGGRFVALFLITAAAGSAFYVALNAASPIEAFGASGAACGVFGAYFATVKGDWRASLSDRQVQAGIVVFLGVNVVLVAGVRAIGLIPIAWEAHLGGFLAGVVLGPVLAARRG